MDNVSSGAMHDLGIRLFAALRIYAMGGGSMDKAYREMRNRKGNISPRLLELAEHGQKVLDDFRKDAWSEISHDTNPLNN